MNAARARAVLLALTCVLGPALLGFSVSVLLSPALFADARSSSSSTFGWPAIGLIFASFCVSLATAFVWQRTMRGMPGRLRSVLVGYAFALCALAAAAVGALVVVIAPSLPTGSLVSLDEALLLSASSTRGALIAALSTAAVSGLCGVACAVSSWFLLPFSARARLWWLIDGTLIVACVWALGWPTVVRELVWPLWTPPPGLAGSSLRLSLKFVFWVRVGVRLLPTLLNSIELTNFRALVAARHLRAKKSGFLAAIAFLSILAVSVSTCALTTVLSVMGGFRQDLKRKILGNNAHIVIDAAHDRIPADEQLQQQVRAIPGVRGVSAYVSGEVMISSSSNLSGAVLRGIDPAHIAEVSELPKSMRMGSLEYLEHPERLSRAPSSNHKHKPKVLRAHDESDVPKLTGESISQQLEKALRDARVEEESEALDDEEEAGSALARQPILPGIVVGAELARSLRLYLGDEVNIVTPLGALGPTGPMPKSRPFRVAGIFYSGMYEYDMKFAYVTLQAAQSFLNTGHELTGVEVTVQEPDRAPDIAQAISSRIHQPKLRVRPWQELNKNLFGALALEKLAMFIALGIAILVASFCVGGTLTLMVQEKGREVAVLKAMGAADRAIVGIFVLEGMLIGVFGAVLGLSLGYAVCFAAENFGVRLNPEVYYIDKLPVHIDPSEFLAVGLSAVVVCLLVTIYPAQLASRLRPVDALRFE